MSPANQAAREYVRSLAMAYIGTARETDRFEKRYRKLSQGTKRSSTNLLEQVAETFTAILLDGSTVRPIADLSTEDLEKALHGAMDLLESEDENLES